MERACQGTLEDHTLLGTHGERIQSSRPLKFRVLDGLVFDPKVCS